MSDGSKEIGRELEQKTKKPAGGEDFVRAIAKIAVSQICENEGFVSFQQSTLDALADVAVRYVKEIGKTANVYANLAGRSECNVLDVIRGLEDLGSIQGFPGCSDVVHHSLSGSGVVREMRQYVGLSDEVPFAYALPRFPVLKECSIPISFARARKVPPGEHIPAWLPVFPNLESNLGFVGDKGRVEEEIRVQERGEISVMMMHQGFVANNGSEALFGPGDSSKQKRISEINPFLVPPLLYGEKEVSSVAPPSRFLGGATLMANHVTGNVMDEGFALAVEAPQNKVFETDEKDKSIGFDGRQPVIRFKLSSGRKSKSLPSPTNVIGQDNGDEELDSGFEMRDAEKGEKKRRAVQILKESMENPLDPT